MSEYVPKADAEGINSPANETPLRDLAFLFGGFLAVVLVVFLLIGIFSDFLLTRISMQSEMRILSRVWTRSGLGQNSPPSFKDIVGLLNAHIQFPLRVDVTCAEEANAFALPGGAILLTSGLLETVHSENGLAFVLAHEIGHFVNRDHIRGLGRAVLFQLGLSMIGIGTDISGLQNLAMVMKRHFDREQEEAADEYALILVNKIYGHTWGADELFVHLAEKESSLQKTLARFTSTHPLSADRLARIRSSQNGSEPHLKTLPTDEWLSHFRCPRLGRD